MSVSLLLLGVLFSSIGLGFLVYGKKQQKLVPLVCGLALLVVPYFFSSALLLLVVGAVLVAIPFFVRI
jgi:formate/nitrite transporter FocA (FNT family)